MGELFTRKKGLFWYILKLEKTIDTKEEALMDYSRIARKLREKIAGFSGEVSKGLPKTGRRFVREMLYRIQASQSVVLTKVGRMLEEEISIKKVQERLCRQLQREGLDQVIQKNLLKTASGLMGKDTLLILDPTDIRKKYARKMEFLGNVRDGSEGVLAIEGDCHGSRRGANGSACWQIILYISTWACK
jgi:hypothetical protein